MKKQAVFVLAAAMLLGAAKVQAVNITFTTSGVIDQNDVYDNVYIYNDDTIVDMLGGDVDSIGTYDASTVNVTGGHVNTLGAHEFSTANVSGGYVYSLGARDSATVNLSDTGSAFSLAARGNGGTVNMSGGTTDHASALESGILNISAGLISDGIGADYSGTLNMTGGTTQGANFRGEATANLFGGVISDFLMAAEDSIVNIYGYDLFKTSSEGSYGYGFVTGYWDDGTPFTIDLDGSGTYSHINLIPEPSSCIVFALGSLILKQKKILLH